jgi:putative ABC transport system permease protein
MGKLPTAWLQLRHQKMRLIIALAGVVFAVVIVFMQLGIQAALFNSAVRLYEGMEGDCFLISPRSNALIAMEGFSERRLLQVMAFPEVEFVSPIYLGFVQWRNPQLKTYWRKIFAIGFDLRHLVFTFPGVRENLNKLKLPDTIIFDQNSRGEFGEITSEFYDRKSVVTEVNYSGSNRKLKVVGLFEMGTSFGADGNILTSHLNFLRIFRDRPRGVINLGLIKLKPEVDVQKFVSQSGKKLPRDVKVLSKQELIKFEQSYWNSSTPIGFIFSLGVTLGIIVGIVVVYQILYANVAEHLPQYATLKAMGYENQYLLSMVLQQAVFIAILGYIPGFLISIILYKITQEATLLPVGMTLNRALSVLILTIIMCFISGATAIRKLREADPADIF